MIETHEHAGLASSKCDERAKNLRRRSDSARLTTQSMTQVAQPTFIPAGKTTPSGGIAVKVKSATAYCRISYTTDRTTPTRTHGRIISNGANATITAGAAGEVTKTLKAIAFKSGMTPSAVRSGTYVLNSSIL